MEVSNGGGRGSRRTPGDLGKPASLATTETKDALDDALEASFPASDPAAATRRS